MDSEEIVRATYWDVAEWFVENVEMRSILAVECSCILLIESLWRALWHLHQSMRPSIVSSYESSLIRFYPIQCCPIAFNSILFSPVISYLVFSYYILFFSLLSCSLRGSRALSVLEADRGRVIAAQGHRLLLRTRQHPLTIKARDQRRPLLRDSRSRTHRGKTLPFLPLFSLSPLKLPYQHAQPCTHTHMHVHTFNVSHQFNKLWVSQPHKEFEFQT